MSVRACCNQMAPHKAKQRVLWLHQWNRSANDNSHPIDIHRKFQEGVVAVWVLVLSYPGLQQTQYSLWRDLDTGAVRSLRSAEGRTGSDAWCCASSGKLWRQNADCGLQWRWSAAGWAQARRAAAGCEDGHRACSHVARRSATAVMAACRDPPRITRCRDCHGSLRWSTTHHMLSCGIAA